MGVGGDGGGEELGTCLECLEDIWDRDAEVGFMECVFDPVTQRRVNIILNSRSAAMAGMHKEEVLARLAAHEAPISCCLPLDFLQAVLHQSLHAAAEVGDVWAQQQHVDVMHLLMMQSYGGRRVPILIRMEAIKLFNTQGQMTQARASPPLIFCCQAAFFWRKPKPLQQNFAFASPDSTSLS